MSYSDEQSPFFPPVLKWISIGFFAVIFLSVAYVALNLPESYKLTARTESSPIAPTPSISQRHNSTPTSTTSASPTTSIQTNDTSHQSITPTQDQSDHHLQSSPSMLDEPTQPSELAPLSAEKEQQAECIDPNIKGVIWDNKKFYFKKGVQGYDVIDRLLGADQIYWLCNWRVAEIAGWQKASPSLYHQIQLNLNNLLK